MHSLLLRPGNIEIHVGDPIETSGMTPQDRGRLNEMLRDRVAELAGETVPPQLRPGENVESRL